jgi:hypothetical protein
LETTEAATDGVAVEHGNSVSMKSAADSQSFRSFSIGGIGKIFPMGAVAMESLMGVGDMSNASISKLSFFVLGGIELLLNADISGGITDPVDARLRGLGMGDDFFLALFAGSSFLAG